MDRSPKPLDRSAYLAALVAGLVAPIGAGGYLAMVAITDFGWSGDGFGRMRAFGLLATSYESAFVRFVGLAILAWPARLALALATMESSRSRPEPLLTVLRKRSGRALRARRVSVMVATVFGGASAGLLVRLTRATDVPALDAILATLAGLAITAAFAAASMADRAAAYDVDGTQDARAAQLREEARYGGPHYLDTSSARGGYDVATSADDATTAGLRPFLGAKAWLVAALALAADAIPVLLSLVVVEVSGVGPAWLTPGWSGFLLGPAIAASLGIVLLRAAFELGLAFAWTRVYRADRGR